MEFFTKIEKKQPKGVDRILSEHILIDNQNQQYKELFVSDMRLQAILSPSEEFEYSVFFELPKNWNINNFKKIKTNIYPSSLRTYTLTPL